MVAAPNNPLIFTVSFKSTDQPSKSFERRFHTSDSGGRSLHLMISGGRPGAATRTTTQHWTGVHCIRISSVITFLFTARNVCWNHTDLLIAIQARTLCPHNQAFSHVFHSLRGICCTHTFPAATNPSHIGYQAKMKLKNCTSTQGIPGLHPKYRNCSHAGTVFLEDPVI